MTSCDEVCAADLRIETLGPCKVPSPLRRFCRGDNCLGYRFVSDDERVLFEDSLQRLNALVRAEKEIPSVELAGPRANVYFDPEAVGIAIVTCGGLCPGLNNVIRSVTLEAHFRYGVQRILGVPYGFQGFIPEYGHEPIALTREVVRDIHCQGGTILSSSRGRQEPSRIVDWLVDRKVGMLFVVGGDGSQRGALAIHQEIKSRGLKIAVVGVPKTIDNDMSFIDKSFGFETAVARAVESISSAHVEAQGAPNGVGLVKLMGRSSGFIACHAALARSDVNFVLIPEVPLIMEGEQGFLNVLEGRLKARGHAVIVVAEGAGQDLVSAEGTDASGNRRLGDIGLFLKDAIAAHFKARNVPVNLKYIDPSYLIRSVAADPLDSLYCARLAQHAVHAAMAGKTAMVVGRRHQNYVHLPTTLVTSSRQMVDPQGDLWQAVLATTGQPPEFR